MENKETGCGVVKQPGYGQGLSGTTPGPLCDFSHNPYTNQKTFLTHILW